MEKNHFESKHRIVWLVGVYLESDGPPIMKNLTDERGSSGKMGSFDV